MLSKQPVSRHNFILFCLVLSCLVFAAMHSYSLSLFSLDDGPVCLLFHVLFSFYLSMRLGCSFADLAYISPSSLPKSSALGGGYLGQCMSFRAFLSRSPAAAGSGWGERGRFPAEPQVHLRRELIQLLKKQLKGDSGAERTCWKKLIGWFCPC